MAVQLYPESIKQQTWVGRALNLVEPRARAWVPWPVAWQSGRNPEFEVYLPESIGGDVPAAEAFITAQIALEKASAAAAGEPTDELAPPAVRVVDAPEAHGTYSVDCPAGVSTIIYQGSRQRAYSLIVNGGANDAFLAYGKDADARSLPLASGGDGFHELLKGTTSSASVFSPAGTFVTVVDGVFDPEVEDR